MEAAPRANQHRELLSNINAIMTNDLEKDAGRASKTAVAKVGVDLCN